MKKPTLKEVKEYFKDAKVVKCLSDDKLFNISEFTDYREYHTEVLAGLDDFDDKNNEDFVSLYNENRGYAEIIETKERNKHQDAIERSIENIKAVAESINEVDKAIKNVKNSAKASFPKGGIDFAYCGDERAELLVDKNGNIRPMPQSPKIPSKSLFGGMTYCEIAKSFEKLNLLKTPKMEKELIGYKLRDEKLKDAVDAIVGFHLISKEWDKENMFFSCFTGLKKLGEAGVLNNWFTPVYKEEVSLVVGRWYFLKDFVPKPNALICFQGGDKEHYGFGQFGWTEHFGNSRDIRSLKPVPATDKEVFEAMFAEVKKRYKKGDKIICLDCPQVGYESLTLEGLEFSDGLFWSKSTYEGHGEDSCIFKNGKWAEILEDKFNDFEYDKFREGGDTLTYKGYPFDVSFVKSDDFECLNSFTMKDSQDKWKFSKADVKLIKQYAKEKL